MVLNGYSSIYTLGKAAIAIMAIEFAKLKVGDYATITKCELLAGSQAQRLMMLGLTPGTSFKVVRVAPLGDPIEIKIRGFNLSLRRAEALGIWVDQHEK